MSKILGDPLPLTIKKIMRVS